jgi:dissimilatory sulfite reductase (desulfoviridin) alpha/beta subunit
MEERQEEFSIDMPKVGIIKGVLAKDIEVIGDRFVSLRTAARPFKNVFTAAQLRAVQSVLVKYGSGKAHLTPRYNLEIPEIGQKNIDTALRELYCAGLFPGGAGTSVRNVYTCPDWCAKSIRPVQELGAIVSRSFGDQDMPNKVTISFAGCANGCSRPHTCDIGVIAAGTVTIGTGACPDDCAACVQACRFGAIAKQGNRVALNEKCTGCSKCVEACGHGTLALGKTSFTVLIGNKEGTSVRFGTRIADQVDDFAVLGIIDWVLHRYREHAQLRPGSARKKERLIEVIDRLGIEAFQGRKE